VRIFFGRNVDIVTPNGFEKSFTPPVNKYEEYFKSARKRLTEIATLMTGFEITDDTVMMAISGRYEFKNKGIDLFSMLRLS
jgi:phosphorylase/glycogen(starch) synthase